MESFFLLTKIVFIYGLSIYLIFKKGELSIIYLPLLFFVEKIVGAIEPAYQYYGLVCLLILLLIIRNLGAFRNNIWSLLLIVYFLFLLNRSSNLQLIRPYVFSVIWLFTLVPLIPSIYKKYTVEVVMKELKQSCLLILILFIANAMAATLFKYAPIEMYGITSGVRYGNIWAAGFNTLPVAFLLIFLYGISERKLFYLFVSIVSVFFIMLTLRRTVMGLTAFAILISLLTMLTRQKSKMLLFSIGILAVAGYFIYTYTDFMSEFKERVELRKLDERDLAEEKRFIEYNLLYDDMFVYKDYSPWYGYELFNSAGNYGRGILGERSLHGDIPNLIHSSGLIGVTLYLLMIGTSFWQAIRSVKLYQEKLIVLFCAGVFVVFTVTGRYTENAASLLWLLLLMLPVAQHEQPENKLQIIKQPEAV